MTKPNPTPKPAPTPALAPAPAQQEQHVAMPITTLNEIMALLGTMPFNQVASLVQKVHQTTVTITLNPPTEA